MIPFSQVDRQAQRQANGQPGTSGLRTSRPSIWFAWLLLIGIFLAVQVASLSAPALLDDVDAAHAQAAQHFAENSDWVTAKINGIRYIEKPPLPYWLVAVVYRIAGQSAFSTHLPNSLAMLGLAGLCWNWARQIGGPRAGLYAALGVLTSIGPFLFTRFIIPESILSLFLLVALYNLLTGLEFNQPARLYITWAILGFALLTKGLIAPVFFAGAAIPYLLLTGLWKRWRELKPVTGPLLFLAIAAPWHILAGLANPDQGNAIGNHPTIGNVHGFWWFYFINEHVLRFFGQRYPHDYNKLPFAAYWLVQFVWLFPWSLFLPALLTMAWKTRRQWFRNVKPEAPVQETQLDIQRRFRVRSVLLLGLFTAFTLIFFSISTNLEYYTFPAWPPLFMLIAGVVSDIEERPANAATPGDPVSFRLSTAWLGNAQALFTVLGVLAACVLGWGLWDSRNLPFVSDIGTLLAHRNVAGYTLAMSHLFDLTGPAFAALRLPAILAAVALLFGPALGWILRLKGRHLAATVSVALTAAVFLVAAHIALVRFEPMLSSKQMADTILQKGSPEDSFIIIGEQSDASSVIFYTHGLLRKPALLAYPRCGQNGEGSTLLWGSCYPDAPDIFLSDERLSQTWGVGERKWLFAQDTNRAKAEQLLSTRLYPVETIADKTLWTDRPFN